MKRTIFLFAVVICLLFSSSVVSANTVTINLVGVASAGIDIGSFQLFFYAPDGFYSYPLGENTATFETDFSYVWNSGVQPASASWEQGLYPIQSIGDSDYAKGFAPYSKNTSDINFALNDGLVVTLSSQNSIFRINPTDPDNAFYNFLSPFAEIPGLQISEIWAGNNQTLNVSVVPIPAAVWLLGSGVIGLVALKRRKKA